MILGATAYGPYGPPFKDPALQSAYKREADKLAKSSALITQDTAQSLVATVVNSAMAAVDAQIPSIERRVRSAVAKKIPGIEERVRQEASAGARGGVTSLLLLVGIGAVAAGGVYYAVR